MTTRLPGPTCVMCSRSLDETGGRRIVATNNVGVSLRSIQSRLESIHHPARTIRLEGRWRDVVVVMWGDVWDGEVAERVRQQAQENFRPWMCQSCIGAAICPRCLACMWPIPGADIVENDGKTKHVFVIAGMATRCRNPDCVDFIE